MAPVYSASEKLKITQQDEFEDEFTSVERTLDKVTGKGRKYYVNVDWKAEGRQVPDGLFIGFVNLYVPNRTENIFLFPENTTLPWPGSGHPKPSTSPPTEKTVEGTTNFLFEANDEGNSIRIELSGRGVVNWEATIRVYEYTVEGLLPSPAAFKGDAYLTYGYGDRPMPGEVPHPHYETLEGFAPGINYQYDFEVSYSGGSRLGSLMSGQFTGNITLTIDGKATGISCMAGRSEDATPEKPWTFPNPTTKTMLRRADATKHKLVWIPEVYSGQAWWNFSTTVKPILDV